MLTTVVARVCLNVLRSRAARREELSWHVPDPVVCPHGRVFSVMAFTVTNDRIVQIDALVDPERLEQLGLQIPASADQTEPPS
jgi:hypothetical protein